MGCWNMGILESWVLSISIHHFILPLFQFLRTLSEAFVVMAIIDRSC